MWFETYHISTGEPRRRGLSGLLRIHFQHPHLSLGQIHAALAYYYDRKADFDAEIQRSVERVAQLRSEASESPIRKRLRAMGKLA